METTVTVPQNQFQTTIDDHISRGFRLKMIRSADAPSEAFLKSDEGAVRVRIEPPVRRYVDSETWSVGRAGMMYRDLIPDRLGGKLIASHIRIVEGGPVQDAVHYHKIDFQVIYCLKGGIKVVYEDQGSPFWLRPGDCVLQPPGIRHRVLEAEAGSEVIEITSPADHETWFDQDLELPTREINEHRIFGGQKFVRYQQNDVDCSPVKTMIDEAGNNAPEVFILETGDPENELEVSEQDGLSVRILIGGRGLLLKTKI